MNLQAQVNIITTIGGTGSAGYSGDLGPATNAELYFPNQLCLDKFGNLYFADAFNNRIRKIEYYSGVISTIAGDGTNGFFGDGGFATSAKLSIPNGITIDTSGNIYISDGLNNRLRKITRSTGIITTIAGDGAAGSSGDGGLAINAKLDGPGCLSIDKFGNIYLADFFNHKIRKIDCFTGIITTVAGTGMAGYSGDGGAATLAKLTDPGQAFADSFGNIFFTDAVHSVVRKVTVSTGIITTVAGTGVQGYSGDGGPANMASLNQPFGIFIDSQNNIFIVEWGNGTIRKIESSTGIITTVTGCGIRGFSGDGGPATSAKLKPEGVILDKHGTMFIADMDNNRIRMVYNSKLSVPSNTLLAEITMYPNPTRNEVIIENADGNEIGIYSILGQEVFATTLSSDKQVLNLECLSSGLYVVEVVDPLTGFRMTKQLVISK